MLGSSTIRNFNSELYLECGRWENRGIGTAGIPNLLDYLNLTTKRWKPDWLLIYAGENDVARDGADVDTTIELYNELIEALLNDFPNASLMLMKIKPSPKRKKHHSAFKQINAHLAALAIKDDRLRFIANSWYTDKSRPVFSDDGVHFTELGYKLMAMEINNTCSK